MPRESASFKDRLARYHRIKVNVIGRKSGRTISMPMWVAGKMRPRAKVA